MRQQKKWFITETFRENGEGEVSVTPVNWVDFDLKLLYWPRDLSKKALVSKLESCVDPTKKWKSFKNFDILEDGKEFSKLNGEQQTKDFLRIICFF